MPYEGISGSDKELRPRKVSTASDSGEEERSIHATGIQCVSQPHCFSASPLRSSESHLPATHQPGVIPGGACRNFCSIALGVCAAERF